MNNKFPLRSAKRSVRAGAAILEFILVLPLLIIALMAVVEWGVWYSNLQRVEMAARAGAEVASELPVALISETTNDPVPSAVVQAVERTLQPGGITFREIVLQHNVTDGIAPEPGSFPVVLRTINSGNPCPLVTTPPLPPQSPATIATRYTRVTVYVDDSELAPNLLRTFGLDLTLRFSQQTKTRRYEVLP